MANKLEELKKDLRLTEKNEILAREYNKDFERKVMLEMEISLQKQLNPDEMSSKKATSFNSQNQPVAWKAIPRSEYIKILEDDLEKVDLRIKNIESLFEL